jgi:succinate dehydrogenase/fumarate reductase flavoprotein subunit
MLVIRCIIKASVVRRESRGSFFRTDYPEQDDAQWRRNISVRLDGSNQLMVEKGPLLGVAQDQVRKVSQGL